MRLTQSPIMTRRGEGTKKSCCKSATAHVGYRTPRLKKILSGLFLAFSVVFTGAAVDFLALLRREFHFILLESHAIDSSLTPCGLLRGQDDRAIVFARLSDLWRVIQLHNGNDSGYRCCGGEPEK